MRIFLPVFFLSIVSFALARVPASSFVPCARFLETIQEHPLKEWRATVCYGESNMGRYIPGSLVRPTQLRDAVIALRQEARGFPNRRVIGDEQYGYMADLFAKACNMRHVEKDVLQKYKYELDTLYLDSIDEEIKKLSGVPIESVSHGIDLYNQGIKILNKALKQSYLPEEAKQSLYCTESLFVYRFMNILKQCQYVDKEIERRFLHAQDLIKSARKKENKKE